MIGLTAITNYVSLFAQSTCEAGGNFLNFPKWSKYIEENVTLPDRTVCTPVLDSLNDFWLVGLAVIEILLRVAMLVAIIFVVYGGIKYTASRGNADKVQSARKTLEDALIGVVIAIIATAVVSFIARQFA